MSNEAVPGPRSTLAARHILVLLHRSDASFASAGYLIEFLIREWERNGCTVTIVRGVGQRPRADVVIPHVNLTVTPREYVRFLRAYPNVVNRGVVDISKSRISANLVRRNDAYAGPVIVKTDRNYGGLPERRILPPSRFSPSRWPRLATRLIGRALRRDAHGVPWRDVEFLSPTSYPVFPSIRDVPKGVFENPNLVVEKFLPEMADGFFCVRYYYFFGSAGVNFVFRLKERGIVKAENATDVEEVPVPDELEKIREALGVDFGKFDYVLRDGRVVLFDVNRTPATEALRVWGLRDQVARRLAGGILPRLSPR